MAHLTILADIKNIVNDKWFECFLFGLIGQTKIEYDVILNISKKDEEKYRNLIEYAKNFCKIAVNEKPQESDYICFITDRDILYPHFSFTLMDFLKNRKDVDIVYGTSFLASVDKNTVVENKIRYKGSPFRKKNFLLKNSVYLGSCMFRTEFLKNNKIKNDKLILYKSVLKTRPCYHERDLSERWKKI